MDFKALRKSRNMTQTEAAKSVQVTYMTWQRWEWGGCKPSKENMEKIKEVFGLNAVTESERTARKVRELKDG